MSRKRGASRPAPSHQAGGRRYRPRSIALADGGRLVLNADGSIDRVGADGAVTSSLDPSNPQWPSQAIRFGLRPEPSTVPPTGRSIQDTKAPGW